MAQNKAEIMQNIYGTTKRGMHIYRSNKTMLDIWHKQGYYYLKKEDNKMTTEAQKRAMYKYDDKFERVNCRFVKGTKERIERVGYKSINTFIISAVMEKLEREEKFLK